MRKHVAWIHDAVGQSVLHLLAPLGEGGASLVVALVGSGVAENVPLRLRQDLAALGSEVGVLSVGPTPALLLREELLEQDLSLFIQLGVQALAVLQAILFQLPLVLVLEVLPFRFLVLD